MPIGWTDEKSRVVRSANFVANLRQAARLTPALSQVDNRYRPKFRLGEIP